MSHHDLPALSPGRRLSRDHVDDIRFEYIAWAAVLLGVSLALYVSYRVATQSLLLGSVEGRSVYPYVRPFAFSSVALAAGVSAAVWSLLFLPSPAVSRKAWWLIVWIAAALALQAALRALTPYSFERIFSSEGANSFYTVTTRYFASTVLSEFERVREFWPLHAQSNMPGKLMLVYALRNLSRRPEVLAWLVVLVSNLGAVFLYLFVRDLVGDTRAGMYAAILYLFVPAKLFFFPLLNTVTPVAALACAWLSLRWLQTGGSIWAAAFGAALYGLTFYEPLPLVLGLLFAALALGSISRGEITWPRLAAQSGIVALAFAATFLAVRSWVGFDMYGAARLIARHALEFNVSAGRPYGVWVRANAREFLFGVGVAQVVLFAAVLAIGLWRITRGSERLNQPMTVFCLGLAAVAIVTDLLGINRGEVIRLWIFLACFFQAPAAYLCARLESRAALALVLTTTVLQSALGTAMIGFILPG
jgi:hypothetical protein